MMDLEGKWHFRRDFRFSIYAKGCIGTHQHEEINERYTYCDYIKEAMDAMNT